MADGFDDVYVATRRQLRGVAESLIAGPQYRVSGTIKLAVRPAVLPAFPYRSPCTAGIWCGSAAAHRLPARSVPSRSPRGWTRIRPMASTTWPTRCPRRCPRSRRRGHRVDSPKPLRGRPRAQTGSARMSSGAVAGAFRRRGHRGRSELRRVRRRRVPATPYAYVGPWATRSGPFWNAPFGAMYPLNPSQDVDALTSRIADFFQRGLRELSDRS